MSKGTEVSFFIIMAEYYVPEALSGKTLKQIQQEQGLAFRPDVLANFGGIQESTPLSAGSKFSLADDPGSAEYQTAAKLFTPGAAYQSQQQDLQAQKLSQQAKEAVQPAVNTLQSGIDPLKQKYNDLISSIKGSQKSAIQQTETAATQEFAKRGLLPSSGNFNEFLQSKTTPIDVQYNQLASETGLGAQNAEQSIINAIANLQAQSGLTGFNAAEASRQAGLSLAEQQRQFDAQQKLAQDQFGFTKDQAGKQSAPSISDQFATIGEGSTLFNLLTGQPMYTAPKSYKPSNLGGDTLGLF